MEAVIKEALSLMMKNWLNDNSKKTFELLTEDLISTKNIFCNCLDHQEIKYEFLDNKLIIGNKKIYIYRKGNEI